ncbi:hypothetical protein ACIBL3_01505 [Kribbella sp. NPDC050124]|uniref:hypothetical protein n=1 Tax=Kribbella sp. NPDC050124 TaxID=3364114 RepID=UPI00379C6DFE
MTETELKQRLSAGVDDVEAPPDLLGRARLGGARRLRRRRFLTLTASTLAVAAVGGVAVTAPAVLDRIRDTPVASTPVAADLYSFLMATPTRGDLADDQAYLDQVLTVWRTSHRKSANYDRGIFDHLQGNAKVYWAGNTPAGRVAIVAEHSYLRHHDNIQLDKEGIYTLVGFVVDGKDGKPAMLSDSYPAPGVGLMTGMVATKGDTKALVVLDTGKKTGWSAGRTYPADGGSRREYTPLRFKDGVAVVELPRDTGLPDLSISGLPATGETYQGIVNGGVEAAKPEQSPGDRRLWSDFTELVTWPMTANADKLSTIAANRFETALDPVTDKSYYMLGHSFWTAYGVTANGSSVYLGEQQIDNDPTRVYAVLEPKTGKRTIIPGGVPDANTPLPVSIKLPAGQGWAVAHKDAKLSYRYDGGAWSTPRTNAVLVPAGDKAEVKVEATGMTEVVTLR